MVEFLLPLRLIYLSPKELDEAYPHLGGNLLYGMYQFKCQSHLETLSQTHPNNV